MTRSTVLVLLAACGMVLGTLALMLYNQQQFQQEIRQLREEMARTHNAALPPAPLPPQAIPDKPTDPDTLGANLPGFRNLFREALATDLLSEEQSVETQKMIRSALKPE